MIGNMLRNFIGWDDGEESKYGKAMHIKVSIDVEKPFKKVLLIRMAKGEASKVFFKYERLGNFYYA